MAGWLVRVAAGVLAAAAIALVARRARSLSSSGAVAATVVGAAAVSAGWGWGALLVLYFLVSSLLSHAGREAKGRRTGGIVTKGGARDATQVLANGGVFALCVLCSVATVPVSSRLLAVAAAGALAAATADTWATEIGTLFAGRPRSLLSLRPVPVGTSGAVSVPGTAAMLAGALFIGLAARALALTDAFAAVAMGGAVGAMADSLVGATLQERRWCDVCARGTERRVHDCGSPTRLAGGLAVIDNDAVNLIATLVGAVAAALSALYQ